MMVDDVHATVAIVKEARDAASAWAQLVDVCRAAKPSALWDSLPAVDAAADVRAAKEWLVGQLAQWESPHPVRGLYLGLDVLNMQGEDGYNVELGATARCDPSKRELEWLWECEWYGARHLIAGLQRVDAVVSMEAWRRAGLYQVATYVLVLGYSGVVLAEALAGLPVDASVLVGWGFHDGDLFLLGERTRDGFVRICTTE